MKADQNRYWTAFYTKPRNEKKVAERLNSEGYEVYCPVKTVLKQWSDRKKKVKEVLFTSYLFAFVSEQERAEMLRDQGIVSSVYWLKEPVKIPNQEISAIKEFLNNYSNDTVKVDHFHLGDRLEIKMGPFKGEGGIVERIKGNKIVLSLQTLGLSLQAEIPVNQLV